MAIQVFISYSHRDADVANEFARDLEKAGYEVWLDRTDIRTGSHWDDEIVKGLNASQVFLVLLSNDSVASQNVKDEIGYAIDHNMQILPILLEACEVPFRLRRIQYVDFTNRKYKEGFQDALQVIRSFQSAGTAGKAPAKEERKMDPVTLATTATAFLAPFLAKMGESFMEEAGKRLPDKVGKIWEAITGRFKKNPAASGAASDLLKNAEDKDNQEAFALQLKKALKEDAEFAEALASLLEDAKSDPSISNVGSGAVATNDSIAVGNIKIEGGVSGDFIIGKNNKGK